MRLSRPRVRHTHPEKNVAIQKRDAAICRLNAANCVWGAAARDLIDLQVRRTYPKGDGAIRKRDAAACN
uniref:Uncharacterized protein n=1 Tax=Romanomermis culicivorax TaxID=13658 RepID=A0A915JZE5_ROMCU